MDRKSKMFFIVFFGLIFLVVGITYIKYFVVKDYYIEDQTDCDPATEKCFVTTCSPDNDPKCPEAEADRASYYKLVKKKANLIPLCDPKDENCKALECLPGMDCEEILCDEITKVSQKGTECNDPEEYVKNMEAEKAAEGDCEGEDCPTAVEDQGNDVPVDESAPKDNASPVNNDTGGDSITDSANVGS